MKFEPIQKVLSIKDLKKQITKGEKTVFGYKYMLIGYTINESCVIEIVGQNNNKIMAQAEHINPMEALKQLSRNLLFSNEQKNKNELKPLSPELNLHDCNLRTCSLEEWTNCGFGFISFRYDENTIIFKAETGERFHSIMFVSGKSSNNIIRTGEGKTFEEALKLAFPTEII